MDQAIFVSFLRWFVLAGWLFWILVYWRGGIAIGEDILSAFRNPQTRWDAWLLILLTGNTLLITFANLASCLGWIRVNGSIAGTCFGTCLTWLGISGTFYCRHFLAQAWTARTQVDANHKLVESGPYGVVRHPIYTAAILLYSGLGFVHPIWWNDIPVGIVILSYVFKTQDEDTYLRRHLAGYAEYAQRVTHRLLPKIW